MPSTAADYRWQRHCPVSTDPYLWPHPLYGLLFGGYRPPAPTLAEMLGEGRRKRGGWDTGAWCRLALVRVWAWL